MKRLLVVMPNGIGDLIQIFPLFKLLKEKHSNIIIDALVLHKQLKDIIDRYDYIDNVFSLPYIQTYQLLINKDAKKIIKNLPKYDYAFAPFPSRGIYSAILLKLIKTNYRVSHKYRFKFFNNISWFLDKSTPFNREHLIYNNFKIIKLLGLLKEEDKNRLEEKIYWNAPTNQNKIFNNSLKNIAIYPGGNALFKRWEHNNWKALITKIKSNYNVNILIFLGPNEKDLSQFYSQFIDEKCTLIDNEKFNRVLEILSDIDLFIGNDGGLTHIFSLYQKPQITIFGATDHKYAYPVNPNNINILPKNCKPIWIPYTTFTKPLSENMINNITADDVLKEIDKKINNL